MPVKPPPRWTARSLTYMFMPHMFRNPRNAPESIGPRKEKVPLDADLNHMFIKRKELKMVRRISADFKINLEKPRDTPKGFLWSITTGEWVNPGYLKLECIFPFALGPLLAQEVSPRIFFRGSHNGMLISTAVQRAFNDWTLVIAPQKSCLYEKTPKSLLFRTLSPEATGLKKPIYPEGSMTVGELDRQPLHFKSPATLNPHSCYFHSCLAVWKLTYLEQPDRSAEEFWERFQYKMDGLWGTLDERKRVLDIFKPPELLTPEDVDERGASVEDIRANLEDARANLEDARANVEDTRETVDDELWSVDDEPAVGPSSQEEQFEHVIQTTDQKATF